MGLLLFFCAFRIGDNLKIKKGQQSGKIKTELFDNSIKLMRKLLIQTFQPARQFTGYKLITVTW